VGLLFRLTLALHKEVTMWVLVYNKDYGDHKTGDLHLIGHGKFNPSNHKMEILKHVEVPEQSTKHLFDELTGDLHGKLSDLRRYTPEELAKIPSVARAALKARGTISNETSVEKLRERVALLETIIGV